MKRVLFGAAAVFLLAAVSGCASKPSASSPPPAGNVVGSLPGFVQQWLRSAPDDALYGIGSALQGTKTLSKQTATQRARVEIAQELDSTVKAMVEDYTAGSEADTEAVVQFTETVSRNVSQANLSGSKIWGFDYDTDGTCYVMVVYSFDAAAKLIKDQADAAAKLAPAAAANFAAQDRMDEYLAKEKEKPPFVRSTD